jgi:PAS domain S-box-containing protein
MPTFDTSFVDALPGLVWTLHADGRADFVNRRWCNYTGMRAEELSGQGWRAAVHPHDLPDFVRAWDGIQSAGKWGEVELRLRRYDGEHRWFSLRFAPMATDTPDAPRWCGIASWHAHSHLTEAQRLSHTGSFTWDVQADRHLWSEEIYRIFGLEPGIPVRMPMLLSAIHPEDLSGVETLLGAAVQGDQQFDLVFRIVRPEGTVKHAHVVGHRSEHILDRPVFVGALRDITESKVAEEALHKARAELAHVSRVMTLGALTASIAHEVNQPLSGIITNASTCLLMLDSDPPNVAGARATAQRTLRDGNRAAEVIQHLRALFARTQPANEPVDLNDATREVLALSSSELHRSRVILRTDFDANLPTVHGDRVQLQQVILNLIINAADSMREIDDRPRHLLVATSRDDGNGTRLSVSDTGIGIDPQNIEQLFNAFYTTKRHGMGVGLSISRTIIESHAGRLWAAANEDHGATFCFCLPGF